MYCHNPDMWESGGRAVTVDEAMADILRYRNFIRSGGVTFSGGEPLLQADFVRAMCEACRGEGLHTAIDTSGAVELTHCHAAMDAADLVLLDIKAMDPEMCRALTGQDNANALRLLEYCEETGKEVWVRQVIVPGYTLDKAQVKALREHCAKFKCVKKVTLLPFHKLGMYKWEKLGMPSPLADVREVTAAEMDDLNF